MLEHRVLLLRPCSASGVRTIVDGDSGKPLGFARREVETPRRWWRLLARGVLSVREHEDEPLLCTIRRAWSLLPCCIVSDAEGQQIGSLLGRILHDRYGRPLAAFHDDGAFRGSAQRVLARLSAAEDGLRLAFSDDIAGEPFIKMLLLSAALQMTH